MSQYQLLPKNTTIREALSKHYRIDEQTLVNQLVKEAEVEESFQADIQALAKKLVSNVRENRQSSSGVDALMHEFSLSSQEGIALMCLAEALLRIPDKLTADKLIKDKIAKGDWRSHVGNSSSIFVNASSWGLLITGKIVSTHSESGLSSALNRLIARGGEPLIRQGVNVAMRLLGKQFVTGETIEKAILNGVRRFDKGFRYSYDMLGEAALTDEDAARYYKDYEEAIHEVGKRSNGRGVYDASGVSIKLSAIHPRYSLSQHQIVMDELYPRLKELFLLAKKYDIGLNIDAEEADRLEISLDLLERLLKDPDLAGFNGIGFVIQAYQKRCPFVIDFIVEKARETNHKVMIRLVKGAYWDTEIKIAQTEGLESFPVYTRKVHTDVSYIACAKRLLAAQDAIYPQFATHNAQSLATIYQLAKGKSYEFQCLHGMGETLYDQVVGEENLNVQCRIYAPVGSYKTLLAYLVRRLLENGANSSFVNQIVDENISIDSLIEDPVKKTKETEGSMHPTVALPDNIFGDARPNSKGYDLTDAVKLKALEALLVEAEKNNKYVAEPLLGEDSISGGEAREVLNPAEQSMVVGTVIDATEADVEKAFELAEKAKESWKNTSPADRATILENMADALEENMATLFDLAVREAGKTFNNAIAELREAVDFCRYYAREVRNNPKGFQSPRGIVVTISPWNFPLAIFTGELCSALVAGNVVLAKPAEQTSLIAHYAVKLYHDAGVPKDVLQLLPGSGRVIGAKLVTDPRVDGVIFTGSTDTAKNINSNIAKQEMIVPLIAETGGQNAMIVDSSALSEQVVQDVVNSAFDSAGQRCSALRVLYLQSDIADGTIEMLKGAMARLNVGRTQKLSTDIGPVIDKVAQMRLLTHIYEMGKIAKDQYQVAIDPTINDAGLFVPPTMFEIDSISRLTKEVFGPVLHIIRYEAKDFSKVIAEINSSGFGLTSGIHTRINETIEEWINGIEAGNLYVNRNVVGAIVGVQPFGGQGLSGTGPKAGGPLYLQRLANRTEWNIEGLEGDAKVDLSSLKSAMSKVLSGTELQNVNDLIQEVSRTSPVGKVLQTPGVTGEENYMTLVPRGEVAISNGALADQAQALVAVVGTGSKAIVNPDSELAKFKSQLSEFMTVANELNDIDHLSQMIVLDPLTQEQKAHYAERKGAILTYIENLDLALSLFPLTHEKAVSIDTTAAGGNAALMAQMD